MRRGFLRSVRSVPIVIALTIGITACTSADAEPTTIANNTAPSAPNSIPLSDDHSTEPSTTTLTPPTEAELLTAADLAVLEPESAWHLDDWDGHHDWDSGSTEPYSIHICGPDTPTLKWIHQFADMEHVDHVVGGTRASVAEAVFAGTPEELADAYETTALKLSECLANPQEMFDPPAEGGFDVAATPLPSLGLGHADFSMHQQIVDLCDHRLALVLTDTRLIVVELTDQHFGRPDQFTDDGFRAVVEKAVRRTAA